MNLKLSKTYVIKFKNKENFLQFSIDINRKLCKQLTLKSYTFKEKYICIIKIPLKHEILIPLIKEYGFIKPISKSEEAYYIEYGKIIKP